MSTSREQSLALFEKGFNCCQSVISVYAEHLGLDSDGALKLSSGFGAGMGRMGKACGTVTGAFMAIGLKFGTAEPGNSPERARTFELIREFSRQFEDRHGSLTCKELLGFDMSTPEGNEAAKQPGSFDICTKLIESSIEILEGMLKAT